MTMTSDHARQMILRLVQTGAPTDEEGYKKTLQAFIALMGENSLASLLIVLADGGTPPPKVVPGPGPIIPIDLVTKTEEGYVFDTGVVRIATDHKTGSMIITGEPELWINWEAPNAVRIKPA